MQFRRAERRPATIFSTRLLPRWRWPLPGAPGSHHSAPGTHWFESGILIRHQFWLLVYRAVQEFPERLVLAEPPNLHRRWESENLYYFDRDPRSALLPFTGSIGWQR